LWGRRFRLPPNPGWRYIEIVPGNNSHRILIGTAATGLVRVEWVAARYGQVIPTNWSNVIMTEALSSFVPLRFQVADAQNLIVKQAVEGKYEWLLLWEHDVCAPPDTFIRLGEHMDRGDTPVVSGLYWSQPSL
jgi:hypothetical protein